jgi:predicted CopG family antitoxin
VWKFVDAKRLFSIIKRLSEKRRAGTNLEIINAYFSGKTAEEIEIVAMKKWINCNTIHDYDDVLEALISGSLKEEKYEDA